MDELHDVPVENNLTEEQLAREAVRYRASLLKGRGMMFVPTTWTGFEPWSIVSDTATGIEYVVIPDVNVPGPDAFLVPPLPDVLALEALVDKQREEALRTSDIVGQFGMFGALFSRGRR